MKLYTEEPRVLSAALCRQGLAFSVLYWRHTSQNLHRAQAFSIALKSQNRATLCFVMTDKNDAFTVALHQQPSAFLAHMLEIHPTAIVVAANSLFAHLVPSVVCEHERRVTIKILLVNVRTMSQQGIHHILVPSHGRRHQGRRAILRGVRGLMHFRRCNGQRRHSYFSSTEPDNITYLCESRTNETNKSERGVARWKIFRTCIYNARHSIISLSGSPKKL